MLPKAADTNRSKRRRRPCIQSSRKRGSTGSDSHGRRPVWRPPRRLMPFGRKISKPRACRQIENFVQTFPIIGLLFKQTQEYGLAPISLSQALGGQSNLLNSTWCSFFSIPFQCKCFVYFAPNTLIRQTSLVLAPGGGIMLGSSEQSTGRDGAPMPSASRTTRRGRGPSANSVSCETGSKTRFPWLLLPALLQVQ